MSTSFRDLIRDWPLTDAEKASRMTTPEAIANDIGAKLDTVRQWRHRNRIPADHWLPLADAAKRRGLDIEISDLAGMVRNSVDSDSAEHAA